MILLIRQLFWMWFGWHCYHKMFMKDRARVSIEVWGNCLPGKTSAEFDELCSDFFREGWTCNGS